MPGMPPSLDDLPKPAPLDLNNVANLGAAKKAGVKVEEIEAKKSTISITKKKNGKFNFIEPHRISLPSKGIPYKGVTEDEDINNGYILMYPMTTKDEEILSTPRFLKDGSALRLVLDNCIASKIQAKDIVLYDFNYLLFYLRSISLNDEYTFSLTCQNSSCEQDFDHTVKISQLEFDELPDDFSEPIEVPLSVGYTCYFMLPRMYHSEVISNMVKNTRKSTSDADTDAVDNLVATTVQILDPDGSQVDKRDWKEFYESLPTKDTNLIRDKRDFVNGFNEIKNNCVCPYCATKYKGVVPITGDFFRPRRR
jgi:rubredoxin